MYLLLTSHTKINLPEMLVANVKCFKSKHTMELKNFSEMMQLVLRYSQFHEIITGQ